eukprot:144411_1
MSIHPPVSKKNRLSRLWRLKRSTSREAEYVYKRLMPQYGQFVVTLTSIDESTHLRFLQQFFECNTTESIHDILAQQRPKLYRFCGLARDVEVNTDLINVATFPCSTW